MSLKIAILGCGPAGMFAAHAAHRGFTALVGKPDVTIFSKPRKSFMKGAQYLHHPIPGLDGENDPFEIDYQLYGTIDQYREKVYGDSSSNVQVSVETLVGKHHAWDIRRAYADAWRRYEHLVIPWDAQRDDLPSRDEYDVIFSTIPARMLCETGEHRFESEFIWSNAVASPLVIGDNTVACEGIPSIPWYRSSRIQGYETTEYPDGPENELLAGVLGRQAWHVEKPLRTNCNCNSHIWRSGRYGKWTKGVLAHESYEDMRRALIQEYGAALDRGQQYLLQEGI